MKSLSISYKGMEDITALEIKELLDVEAKIKESCVVFEAKEKDLAKYCYKAQGVNRVLLLLDQFKISKIEDLKRISKIDFSKWLKDKSFAARCEIVESEIDAREVEKATGDEIDAKVNLKNPDVTVFVYIYKDNCYVGIDFSGDLSKRDYKIFTTRDDIKGTIAYALVRLSGYDNTKSFLNLNAKAGTIAIEAALFGSGLSVNFFNKEKFAFLKFIDVDLTKFDTKTKPVKVYASDSEGYLRVVKKNAKIAGVEIQFDNIEAKASEPSGEGIEADCIVKLDKKTALIKDIEKEREIKHGKESLKTATFLNP